VDGVVLLARGVGPFADLTALLRDGPVPAEVIVGATIDEARRVVRAGATCLLVEVGAPADVTLVHALAREVPVIAMTRSEDATMVTRALRAGAQDCVALSSGGTVLGAIVARAVERHRYVERMLAQALRDPLTGLANRTLFLDRADHALAAGRRAGTACAVVFLDLDGFKGVNDSLGHAAGDRILREYARRIAAGVRPSDTVGRWGGDELTVLCVNTASPAAVVEVAERLVREAARPFAAGSRRVRLSASAGVAFGMAPAYDAPGLVAAADAAMYDAKLRGGGAVRCARGAHRVTASPPDAPPRRGPAATPPARTTRAPGRTAVARPRMGPAAG
jgi:diguanylate cyclase (GGDEF)-like protein